MSWTPISDDLRQLAPHELALGRVTPANIVDRHGRVVLEKGTRFGPEHAHIVKKHGFGGLFVGPDWPAARTGDDLGAATMDPDELIESLRRKTPTRSGRVRVRSQARHRWKHRIALVAMMKMSNSLVRRDFEAVTRDLSRSGFAFVAPMYLYEGTVVYATFSMLPGRPVMKAIVRNCQLVSGREYRVGVEFVPLDLGETPPL